jgi:hypothetical protein
MTKNNIFLLDGYTSYYTLGALSDDSDDVLTISQILYDGGTFDIKNLVSKAFDVKSFETSVVFDIKNTRDLKKLNKPNQPYNLKAGSNVRYKNKSYDVIGFYYNQFAQLNIVSPILFNPSSLVSDVSNLFYGLKTNDEVKQIINDNLKAGKYSADILFPLTVGVKNFKKELSNILQPPFTSLDSISIKRKEQVKSGEPLIPYKLDLNQLDFDMFKANMDDVTEWKLKKDDASYLDIKDFKDLVEKKIDSSQEYNIFNSWHIFSHLTVNGKQNALLPYNLISQSASADNRFSDLATEIAFSTPIGKIKPILRLGVQAKNYGGAERIGGQYIFGIGHGAFARIKQNTFINSLLFSDPTLKGNYYDLTRSSNDFLMEHEPVLGKGDVTYIDTDYSAYVLKENTFYGGFFATSGTIEVNSDTDNQVLPFGAVFKKNGIYYYLISYLSDEYCFCVKTSTRKDIINPNFNPYTKTEIKTSFKKFKKREVFDAFKKDGHIFQIPDSYYSLPMSKPSIDKEERKDVNSTLVTDVFLDKRKEQFDVLQNNFPELGNTFLGILSVLDKSLSKPKLDKLVFEKGLIYLTLFEASLNNQNNEKKYSDDDNDLARMSKMIGEKELSQNYIILKEQKEFSKISKVIVDLAVDTSKIKIFNPLYIGLKTFEDYQKYALTRLVLNIYDNASLWELNGSMTYNRNQISFPSHNDINLLSKDVFLGDLPSMFLSGIKSESTTDGVENFFYVGKQWNVNLGIRLKDLKSIRTRLYRIAQMIFVSNILQLLYKNAYNVLISRANNSYDEFIENSNLIRQIKQFDLSIPFDEYVDNLKYIQFKPNIKVRRDFLNNLSETDLKLADIFRFQNNMQFNRNKDIFKELILQLDKLYGGVFKLKERIIDNKSKKILNNFPKNEEKESIISQEYELLKDYKEKGYLLISNSEENEMLIDSHNDLVDEETGDVISIGIDKNQTYIISSSDEQTERWRSYGFLDEKPNDIEEDIFDDTDLFEDAFEELGDEFLENLEELDIDELI